LLIVLLTVSPRCRPCRAVALGGSHAQGTHRPDSDWDLALYYRDAFDPQTLRDIGCHGHVSEIGEWGGGVFNGDAWQQVEGHRVDVHYRDLDSVEHELAEATAGRFRIEPLLFHLALAGRGEWITNEKTLLVRAGLSDADRIIARAPLRPWS
jgi:predicted nucleotidyltransferase